MPLSAAVTPTLGGAGWLLNLIQKHWSSSSAASRVSAAVGQPAAVERVEVPVEVAGAERVPGVELGGDAQVDEPVRLQRLPEVARRVRRDARADLGDALKLGFARRIGLDRGQLARLLRVPLGEADHRVQRRCAWP